MEDASKKNHGHPRQSRLHMYEEIIQLYQAGWSYREGAKKLGIPIGTFAGTLYRERGRRRVISKIEVDERHQARLPEDRQPSLPKLKFLEGK